MVDAKNGAFRLQARTVVAPGNLSIATVFSAGAAKEDGTSKVEVRVKKEGKIKRNTPPQQLPTFARRTLQ